MVQESAFNIRTSTGINHLTQITPDQILSSSDRYVCSTVYFKKHLFLAVASYGNDNQPLVEIKIFKMSNFLGSWEEVCRTTIHKEMESSLSELQSTLNSKTDPSIQIDYCLEPSKQIICLSLVCWGKLTLYYSKDGQKYFTSPIPNQHKSAFNRGIVMTSFQGQIYLFSQKNKGTPQQSEPILLVNSNSSLASWQEVNFPFFDDPDNIEISTVKVFNNSLYVAIVNQKIGFQVWQLNFNANSSSLSWQLVLDKGAYFYNLSPKIFSFGILNNALYALSGTSKSQTYGIRHHYKDQFDILSIYTDNDWDLMVGTPRFSPNGLKVPFSCIGPNFSSSGLLEFRYLEAHQQRLYLSTFSEEGFQIWISEDGEAWMCIPEMVLDDYSDVMVNYACSTPWGLLLCLTTVNFENQQRSQIMMAH